jgi:hypothetical protein
MHALPTIMATTLVTDRRARYERTAERRRLTHLASRRQPVPTPAAAVRPLAAGRTPAAGAASTCSAAA